MVIAAQFLDEHVKVSRELVENVKNYTNTEKVNKRLKLIRVCFNRKQTRIFALKKQECRLTFLL